MPGRTVNVRLLTATFSPYRLVSPSSSIMRPTLKRDKAPCHFEWQRAFERGSTGAAPLRGSGELRDQPRTDPQLPYDPNYRDCCAGTPREIGSSSAGEPAAATAAPVSVASISRTFVS